MMERGALEVLQNTLSNAKTPLEVFMLGADGIDDSTTDYIVTAIGIYEETGSDIEFFLWKMNLNDKTMRYEEKKLSSYAGGADWYAEEIY